MPSPRHHHGDGGEKDTTLAALRQISLEDPLHPFQWPLLKRWAIVVVYCALQVFVSMTTTSYVSVEFLIQEEFGVLSAQVATLGQSLFIVGNAFGPVFLGPLS